MDSLFLKAFLFEKSSSEGLCHVPFFSMFFGVLFGIGNSWLQKNKTNKKDFNARTWILPRNPVGKVCSVGTNYHFYIHSQVCEFFPVVLELLLTVLEQNNCSSCRSNWRSKTCFCPDTEQPKLKGLWVLVITWDKGNTGLGLCSSIDLSCWHSLPSYKNLIA